LPMAQGAKKAILALRAVKPELYKQKHQVKSTGWADAYWHQRSR
jgi:hypothetical protein